MAEGGGRGQAEGHQLRRGGCVMIHAVRIQIRNDKPHLVLGSTIIENVPYINNPRGILRQSV